MLILTLRTDKPESEIGLYIEDKVLRYESWEAHRKLAETIHHKIRSLLEENNKTWNDIEGIVVYRGPGSFTGLRIGISVANALAVSSGIPIVGTIGDDWVKDGLLAIQEGQGTSVITPEYGAPVHITQPKK